MVMDDLKKLANDIFRANSEAEVYRLSAPLTTEETEELAQLIEMAAMKAWATCERAKGWPESELTWTNCVRELKNSAGLYRMALVTPGSSGLCQ